METATKDFNPKVIWAICFILLFSVMNVTMFNIAIPSIADEFSLLHSEVSWVTTGYSIIYALGSLTYGKLADRFPLKRLITIGIVTFCVGSIVGFFAQTYAMLLVGRFIQSAGASSIPALAMLIPARLVPQAQRGKALGTIASTIAFASGIGPIVGGFITGAVSWNYLFLISLGTLLTVPLFLRWLPKENTRTGTFDLAGAALLGVGVVALLLAITNFVWWLPIASAVFFILFALWIRRGAKDPFIQPRLFRIEGVLTCLLITFLSGTAAFGIMIVIPTLLADVNGLSPIHVGFALFPAAMSAALLGRYGGKLADRRGNGFVVSLAQGGILTGLLLLSSVSGHGPWMIAASMAFVSIGFSFMQASITNHVSGLLPREMIGIGMGTFTLVNFLSGSISGAVMMKALDESAGASAVNPFAAEAASGFSNVFLAMAALVLLNLWLVYRTFRGRGVDRRPAVQS
ncbi:MFS transporter [Paenibacillus antri]|uniref:Tetracycline resistance protein n=1 Tax=Paenibacillus antri TaxID=2582848 RepID=A0A5R9G253_9BACL|nr:MFS transporter [Paenibacillus antri]TLS48376.1 MFS transporter [Paenibacillus antri]